jgi:(2Fe-2S) ferredoxin
MPTTAPTTHVLLVGMSVREVQARDRLRELADGVAGSVAFLQLGEPTLSRELTRLADAGVERIVLVGASFGTLAPGVSWLRRVSAYWWRERSGHRPELVVATSLLGPADDLAALVGSGRAVGGAEPGLTSEAWEDVTEHRHQVLVCRGPRCTALGSDGTAEALILALMRHGQSDDDVLVTHTGCQLPCNQAPVVSVQPDDVWYGLVDREVADAIVEEHLVSGRPVETHRLTRSRRPLG